MALSFVGSASGNGSTGATATFPGGVAQNDVVYVAWVPGSTSDLNLSLTTSGYTELADLYANDSNDTNLGIYRKVMGASPDSNVVGPDVGAQEAIACHIWRGANTTTPEDATTTTATGTDSAIPDSPSITTATDGAVVLSLAGNPAHSIGSVYTIPSGYSNGVQDRLRGAGADAWVGIASKSIASHGAENPGAWTLDSADDAAYSWAAASVAIQPAATTISGFNRYYSPFIGWIAGGASY